MGKSVLGLVQLNGLSLVPNPPARIRAFVNVNLFSLRGLYYLSVLI